MSRRGTSRRVLPSSTLSNSAHHCESAVEAGSFQFAYPIRLLNNQDLHNLPDSEDQSIERYQKSQSIEAVYRG